MTKDIRAKTFWRPGLCIAKIISGVIRTWFAVDYKIQEKHEKSLELVAR
jgi:hypothetical protein